MLRKIALPILSLALLAAACSSASTVGSGDDEALDAFPADSVEGADASNSPNLVEVGPSTTFVPSVGGPFNLDGGAERGSDDGVIIDAAAADSLPQPLSSYTNWDTDWTRRTVEDFGEFLPGLGGSDPRDLIRPIDQPSFEDVTRAAEVVGPREPGALVQLNGEARFYPLAILTRHEVVNDAFGAVPIVVSYCPLCNTAIAFDRRVDGQVLRFGVSGLLRNSDLVMWDSATTSLWQQITGEGIVGEFAGTQLETVSTAIVSFEQFSAEFPDGLVLSADSGFGRGNYGRNPYTGYSSSPTPFLFRDEVDDRLVPLARVVGLADSDPLRAYSFEDLATRRVINDTVGSTPVVVLWGGDTADALDRSSIADSAAIGTAIVFDPVVNDQTLTFTAGEADTFVDDQTGSTWSVLGLATDGELAGTRLETVPHRNEFWFAWQAFFGPDTLFEN